SIFFTTERYEKQMKIIHGDHKKMQITSFQLLKISLLFFRHIWTKQDDISGSNLGVCRNIVPFTTKDAHDEHEHPSVYRKLPVQGRAIIHLLYTATLIWNMYLAART
ncbi:hypothetical protein ACJX0J_018404, partial [Zea mays]